ncbi:hypothetical protein AB0910_06140 [Streptomyces sp. NPDC047002]|uniref:hypothetical protein n=1 Tax=Streptomyces sp. NPDC047002 TaxID=3155475 RepID=UPI0034515274
MLEIRPERFAGRSCQVLLDGEPVARWSARALRSGGEIELAGETLVLRSAGWGRSFEMLAGERVRASATREGAHWRIVGEGAEYELTRATGLRGRRRLLLGGRSVGEFRRSGLRGGLTADLSDVPAPLQVFTGLVVLTLWRRRSAATAAAASSS